MQGYMDGFRDALIDYGLKDLGFSGDAFMWRQGRIREQLDIVVENWRVDGDAS
jgi:hypothetical protein